MTQRRRAKTETIKERTIYIYLSNEEMVERWKCRGFGVLINQDMERGKSFI